MKLVYISHWRFPSDKTMSPLIMKTCKYFSDAGFDVELLIPTRWNPKFKGVNPFEYHNVEKNFKITKIPIIDFNIPGLGLLRYALMMTTFNISLFLRCIFTSQKNTVYYSHDLRDVFLLSLFKKNIFIEIHDFYTTGIKFLNPLIFRKARGLVVTNKIKIKKISEAYGVSVNKMLHKPNAVNYEQFDIDISREEARKKLNLNISKPLVVYFGHLFDWKGVDILIEAHELLKDTEIYMVGGVDVDVEAMREKSKLANTNNVTITGHKPHEEAALWFKAADVLILPNTGKMDVSKYETSPVKLFEYMVSGTPIVASKLPSIQNVVDESMVWFFEPDDKEDFAKVVLEVLDSENIAEKTELARKESAKYTWEQRIKGITEFIYD